ncbi:hypothetical protein [Mixta intestinalis]|uniref:Uncharacterized protein n=1 Tax=Mixta intestinalis TaxID=1615494 RepID=A0A6P1PY68_9GAMM|nr:hypothetical protein [Mixta intestinalis]QHM71293.1 hypothetical protein C7M51_01579 [Mixta intestinalis]
MQDWFVSWREVGNFENCGYQVFASDSKDPAHVLAEQMKVIAAHNGLNPRDLLVVAFNKV